MGPNQTYKLLYSKGNHQQNEKTTYRSSLVVQQVKDLALLLQGMAEKQNKTKQPKTYELGENICKQCNQKELVPKIHKQLRQLNNNNNNPIKKIGKISKQTFLQ